MHLTWVVEDGVRRLVKELFVSSSIHDLNAAMACEVTEISEIADIAAWAMRNFERIDICNDLEDCLASMQSKIEGLVFL